MLAGAIDSHIHIVDPIRFPYAADTAYRPAGPETASVERYLDLLDAHGVAGGIVVQPTSGYRFENAVTLDATKRSNGRLRAIVRIDPERVKSDESLLDVEGVAGARLDIIADGIASLAHPGNRRLMKVLAERNLLLTVQVERDLLAQALPALLDSGASICVDHCGRPDPAMGLQQTGFQALLELGRQGHAVKLSGPFRFTHEPAPYRDTMPYIEAILRTFTPVRCCWGSDWPYLRADTRLDYGPGLRLLETWLPDAVGRAQVLRDTPRRLFGFPAQCATAPGDAMGTTIGR